MNLRDRLRDVIRQGSARAAQEPVLVPVPFDEAATPSASAIADALGGAFVELDAASCFVVDREYAADQYHGAACIGDYAQSTAQCLTHAGVLSPGAGGGRSGAALPLLFFDLETTGLSGGAGTHAFLVGCGYFDEGVFRTRQFFLTSYASERALLMAVSALLARIGVLVTFNGKTFDVPVIETRYLFHRLTLPGATGVHLDMLHPARQFWRGRREDGWIDRDPAGGHQAWRDEPEAAGRCTLGVLERSVLGVRRHDDIPGSEIPSRYFHYVRTGRADPLEPVFEHNRLDLLSLAGLTARGLRLAAEGPSASTHARECLGLGRMYERVGRGEAAAQCYRHAAEPRGAAADDDGMVRVDAMRRLALLHRRSRRYVEATAIWEHLMGMPGCPPLVASEAAQALAVHHEHRSKDLTAAHRYACRCLGGAAPHVARDARKRLARVERKLAARRAGPGADARLLAGSDEP